MRKEQREIKDINAILSVLDQCQTIRLGLFDDKFPYIVPLSFGWEHVDNRINIYFHCAKEGKKINLIAKNNAVCFEADILKSYVKIDSSATADYKSVIGFGFVQQIFCDEAAHGLDLLVQHCGLDGIPTKQCVSADAVAVYRINVETITGKQRFE